MLHLAWTLRATRPAQSLIDLKTGWIRRRMKMFLRRISQHRSLMTGDKHCRPVARINEFGTRDRFCLSGFF
ncbi:hypothetical protein ACYZUD_13210 [Pseudomonas sp. XS1P51]